MVEVGGFAGSPAPEDELSRSPMEPYLVVALPLWTETFLPVNVTGLVREWELMLNPVRAAARCC